MVYADEVEGEAVRSTRSGVLEKWRDAMLMGGSEESASAGDDDEKR